ncbi:MAG: hypothetical protein OEY03_00165 [Rhizobacter sp.]|nr:hypothetical protein [Rhizobacter sp.]
MSLNDGPTILFDTPWQAVQPFACNILSASIAACADGGSAAAAGAVSIEPAAALMNRPDIRDRSLDMGCSFYVWIDAEKKCFATPRAPVTRRHAAGHETGWGGAGFAPGLLSQAP